MREQNIKRRNFLPEMKNMISEGDNKEMPLKNPSMLNLNYSFDDSPLNQLTQSYLDDLKQYERKLEVTGDIFAPLSMVSPSISF